MLGFHTGADKEHIKNNPVFLTVRTRLAKVACIIVLAHALCMSNERPVLVCDVFAFHMTDFLLMYPRVHLARVAQRVRCKCF